MADEEKGDNEHTKDGTVDLRGRPFLRAKGGGWAASSFILVSEALERVAYFGVAPNLIVYLTDVLHQGTVTSANNVTNWMGTAMMASIFIAFIADSYLGRYWTYMISSVLYLLGMILLTFTVSLPTLSPPPCESSNHEDCKTLIKRFQITMFYCALYIMALGVAGSKTNSAPLGVEQFDKFDPKEQAQMISFFNWLTFAISIGNLFAATLIIYLEHNVSWLLGYAMATSSLVISLLVFMAGTPLYRHKLPSGSPFTRIAQVLVAAIRKSIVPLSSQDSINELHELESEHYLKQDKKRDNHTSTSFILQFFDKAAVNTSSSSDSPWVLCSISQVEETKQTIRLIPVYILTIMPSVIVAQVFTVFIKQGTVLDQSLGPHLKLPPANLSAVYVLSTLVGVAVYDRLLMPLVSKYTNNPRGITIQ